MGVFNASAIRLLDDLGRRINAVLLHDSLPVPDCTDWASYPFSYFFKPPSGIDTEGKNNNIYIFISQQVVDNKQYEKEEKNKKKLKT